jgi:hypothetical protein
MTEYERKKLEMELKVFTSRNFEKPADCKNAEQIRFYVRELCNRITDMENRFNYAPDWAYSLLAQYNAVQNMMINLEFSSTYH